MKPGNRIFVFFFLFLTIIFTVTAAPINKKTNTVKATIKGLAPKSYHPLKGWAAPKGWNFLKRNKDGICPPPKHADVPSKYGEGWCKKGNHTPVQSTCGCDASKGWKESYAPKNGKPKLANTTPIASAKGAGSVLKSAAKSLSKL